MNAYEQRERHYLTFDNSAIYLNNKSTLCRKGVRLLYGRPRHYRHAEENAGLATRTRAADGQTSGIR